MNRNFCELTSDICPSEMSCHTFLVGSREGIGCRLVCLTRHSKWLRPTYL